MINISAIYQATILSTLMGFKSILNLQGYSVKS